MVGLDISFALLKGPASLPEDRPFVHPLGHTLAHPASVLPDQ
jgi:hypothetical protein